MSCPNCKAGKRHPNSQHLYAITSTERDANKEESGHKNSAAQRIETSNFEAFDVTELDSPLNQARKDSEK